MKPPTEPRGTPRPWTLAGVWDTTIFRVVDGAAVKMIAHCTSVVGKSDELPEDQANAALIVRSVNAHAPLVDALAGMWCSNCNQHVGDPTEVPHPLACPKCRAALAALALARGETS